MEKEMKKLLLVAVSVGIFLLVTITVAIIVLTPKTQETYISSSTPYSNNLPPAPAPAVITATEPVAETKKEVTVIDSNNGDSLTIQIPQPTSAAVPDTAVAVSADKPAVVSADKSAAVSATKPAVASANKPAAVVKKPTSKKAINDYWVQTGAFSSMVRAEDAKEMLFDKGLTSIIETSIINGKNFFRVRLGPYTSENEAKHWLAIVQLIDGFHDSQVRQTVR